MENDISANIYQELITLCEKIENFTLDHPESEKKLFELKNSWHTISANAPRDDQFREIEKRYTFAVEKAEAQFMKKEAPDTQAPETVADTSRLDQIINKIIEMTNKTDIPDTEKQFHQLTREWETSIVLFKKVDEPLHKRYWEACENFTQNKEWILWANIKKKEEICTSLKQLVEIKEDHNLVEKFNDLRGLWKESGYIPYQKLKELNRTYRALCAEIYEKCLIVYKEKEQEKEKNLRLKEALCEEIEGLIEPPNWKQATEFVQKIQQNWDACGPVPKESSDVVWERFKKACASFFERRKQFYQSHKLMLKTNLKTKRELCEKIEALKESTDWKETSQKIKELQKEWHNTGPAQKPQEENLWKQFRAACDFFFNAQKAYFDSKEKERPLNLEKKLVLCTTVENLTDLPDSEKYKQIIELQNEWKNIGPIPKEMEDEVWKRFRKPIDEFFETKKIKTDAEKQVREQNQKEKERLCIEAEGLSLSSDWRTAGDRIKELQREWKKIGPIQRELENAIWHRFHAACETFFTRLKEFNAIQQTETDSLINRKLDLCFQAEIISGVEVSKKEEEERAEWQLKKLTENFWFRVIDEEDDNWDTRAQKLKEFQKEWKEIGTVPNEKDRILWKKFQHACNFFFNKKK
jgi:hypothetical protein